MISVSGMRGIVGTDLTPELVARHAAALGAWALLAAVLASDLGENWIGGVGVAPGTINHQGMPGALVWIGAGAAALALAVAAAAEWLASARQPVGDEARGHRAGEPQAAHGT